MFVYILAPFYLAGCIFLLIELLRWIQSFFGEKRCIFLKSLTTIIFLFLVASPVLASLLPSSPIKKYIYITGYLWLAAFIFSIILTLLAKLFALIIRRSKHITKIKTDIAHAICGTLIIVIVSVTCIYGYMHSKTLGITTYDVAINKQCNTQKTLTIALVADLHLSYSVEAKQIEKMVEIINGMNADIVCFSGDIYSNDYNIIEDPGRVAAALKKIKSRYGCYAAYGNHDVNEKILAGFTFTDSDDNLSSDLRMDRLLEDSNVTLLRDDVATVGNDIYIIGRRDAEKPGNNIGRRKAVKALTASLDKSHPIISIDHEPVQFDLSAEAGVDLMLSGHTHKGQFFPMNITAKYIWSNPYGEKKVDNMTSIVTSGVGVFGAALRIGTTAEVVKINVTFSE